MTTNPGSRRANPGLTKEHIALALIGCGVVGLLVSRRHEVGRQVRLWLVDHHVVLAPGSAAFDIPHLGGLDTGRLLIGVGAIVILIIVSRITHRARTRSAAGPMNRSAPVSNG